MDLKKELQVAKCPHDALSLTNCGILNPADMPMGHTLSKLSKRHIRLSPVEYPSQGHVLTVISAPEVVRGTIGLSMAQRKYLNASIGQNVVVTPYDFDERTQFAMGVTLEVDFQNKKKVTSEPFDTEQMANDFLDKFTHQALYAGMLMVFDYNPAYLLSVVVKKLEMVDAEALLKTGSVRSQHNNVGLVFPNTKIVFETSEGGTVRLIGKNKARMTTQNIINPTWDFQQMGIGGLDNEFNAIFRRAFASRVFPPEIVEQLGCKHVKGILLYGPPGTGKTLMARQIGKMLNSREPKIVNGPEILDKYVGQSEANIRLLFAEAEAEEKSRGPNSGLHIIIFDEIDAICKQRGTVGGSTGVHDTVVNQLLSKIDGVEQLNNILVIGMTNRRDMIDEALLRPGRLEVQIEISLPDEKGRRDILQIHTALMRKNGKMDPDVNLDELATLTKNFSGAEIEGLVKAAQSSAMNSLIKAASKIEVDPEAMEKITITRANFLNALENDIKPAFGTSLETLDKFLTRGVIEWGPPISHALEDGMLLIQQARNSHSSGLVSVLLEGPPNSGKSAIAAELAKNSDFPFIKICSPEDMIGFSESAKCSHIKKIFEDAYKSPLSCVLVDNIERLLDYGPIGPRYSNMVLQALLVLLKKQPPKGRKLIIFCTSSRRQVLEEMEMLTAFSSVLNIPNLTRPEFLVKVLHASDAFTKDQVDTVSSNIQGRRLFIGIKKLLDLIDLMRQTSLDHRVSKFLSKLEEEEVIEVR